MKDKKKKLDRSLRVPCIFHTQCVEWYLHGWIGSLDILGLIQHWPIPEPDLILNNVLGWGIFSSGVESYWLWGSLLLCLRAALTWSQKCDGEPQIQLSPALSILLELAALRKNSKIGFVLYVYCWSIMMKQEIWTDQ